TKIGDTWNWCRQPSVSDPVYQADLPMTKKKGPRAARSRARTRVAERTGKNGPPHDASNRCERHDGGTCRLPHGASAVFRRLRADDPGGPERPAAAALRQPQVEQSEPAHRPGPQLSRRVDVHQG